MTRTTTLPAVQDGNEQIMARQLEEQYGRAVGGLWEVVKFGAMMLHLREILIPRAESKHKGSGRYAAGEGLKAWIEANCPIIKLATAWRFMDLAEGLKNEMKLGKKVNLYEVLTLEESELPPKLQAKREQIAAFLEGKSQRQLLFHFANPNPKPTGGARNAQRLTDEERIERDREDARKRWTDLANTIKHEGIDGKTWTLLNKHERTALYSVFARMSEMISETLR